MAAPRVPNPAKGDAPRVKTNQAFLRLSRRLDALEAALAELGVDVEALEESSGVIVIDRSDADVDVSNTVAATTIYTFDVPADTLDTDGQSLRLTLFGDHVHNSAGNLSWLVTVSLDGVTLFSDSTQVYAQNAARRPWSLQVMLTRRSATTVAALGTYINTAVATAPATGLGDIASTIGTGGLLRSATTDPTVDWADVQTLLVRITASAGPSASDVYTRRSATLEALL